MSQTTIVGPPSGVSLEDFAKESRVPAALLGAIIPTLIGTLFVFARLYTRQFITKNWGADDTTTLLAWVLSIGLTIGNCLFTNVGVGHHQIFQSLSDVLKTLQIAWATRLLYQATISLIKLGICFFYLRIFQDRVSKRSIYVIMGYLGITFIPLELLIIFQCLPIRDAWSLNPTGKCININNLGVASTISTCIADLAMMAFVYPRVLRLQIHYRQKAALLAVVSLGFLAMISAIVRQVSIQKIAHAPDSSFDGYEASTWSAVEIATGFFCASAPCIRPLIRKLLPNFLSNAAKSLTTRHANTIRPMGTQRSRALELSTHAGESDYANMVIKKNTTWSVTSNKADEFEDDVESRGSESADIIRPTVPLKVARKDTKSYYGSQV